MRRSNACLCIGEATNGAPPPGADDPAGQHRRLRERVVVGERVDLAVVRPEHRDRLAVDQRGHAALDARSASSAADRRPGHGAPDRDRGAERDRPVGVAGLDLAALLAEA